MSDEDSISSYHRHGTSKRFNHNDLERTRRGKLKKSFDNLKNALPVFDPTKYRRNKASRIEILKEFHDFAKRKKKNEDYSVDIKQMIKEKARLMKMIDVVREAVKTDDFEAAEPFVDSYLEEKREEELQIERDNQRFLDKQDEDNWGMDEELGEDEDEEDSETEDTDSSEDYS